MTCLATSELTPPPFPLQEGRLRGWLPMVFKAFKGQGRHDEISSVTGLTDGLHHPACSGNGSLQNGLSPECKKRDAEALVSIGLVKSGGLTLALT